MIDKIKSFLNKFFENREGLKQFIQFSLVGVSNVLVMTFTAWALFFFFNAPWQVGITAGFITSVMNAYYWNLVWVFKKSKVNKKTALIKFFTVYIATYFLSMFLSYIFVDVMGQSKYISPLVNTAITTPINFFLSKFWSFKSTLENSKDKESRV